MSDDNLPADVDELLTRSEASAYLAAIGVRRAVSTLAKVRSTGQDGPPFVYEGRKPLYSKRQLHAWGMRQLVEVRRRVRRARP